MHDIVLSLVQRQLCTYPMMELEDIYKLIYQGTMGLGHLIQDQELALGKLSKEMDALSPSPNLEPLFEDITICYPLVRVNLRPYIQLQLSAEQLVTAMLNTEFEMIPSQTLLQDAWNEFYHMSQQHIFTKTFDQLESFQQKLIADDFPVKHHSKSYRQYYFPAYRIIGKRILSDIIDSVK